MVKRVAVLLILIIATNSCMSIWVAGGEKKGGDRALDGIVSAAGDGLIASSMIRSAAYSGAGYVYGGLALILFGANMYSSFARSRTQFDASDRGSMQGQGE